MARHDEQVVDAPQHATLEHSAEQFRLFVDAVSDYAIFLLDPQGTISSWNQGAERIKGFRVDEVLGKHISIFYTEEDRQRGHPQHELQRAVADGRYEEEGFRVRKDGTLFWANVTITAIRDRQGRHIGFTKVTRDLTERRIAEQKLRELNEQLERRVEERTAALMAANQELEAFSYSVSHDLRAPLRALDGFSRILLEEATPRLTDQEQDYLRRIRGAAERMSQLTDAMLMLARLTRSPVHLQRVRLADLGESVALELRRAEPERPVEFVVTPELEVNADARLLRILIENLLRNAWKFTRRTPNPRVELGALTERGERVFFVRDNGVGFDGALKGKLFLPFQRLHRAKEYEGTGIGLATVHRIVERHRGRVWAESAPGEGATFYFTLGTGDRHA